MSWGIARLAFGFAAASIYTVTESWLNDRAGNDTRGRILALYLSVNYGGIVVGQWLYTTAAPTSFVLFNLAAIFYALCLVPVGLTRLPQPQPAGVPQPEAHAGYYNYVLSLFGAGWMAGRFTFEPDGGLKISWCNPRAR